MRERWLREPPDIGRVYAEATPYVDDDPTPSPHAVAYAQFVVEMAHGLVVEVGSGAGSAGGLIAASCDLVMTDVSIERLRKASKGTAVVVADATALPFRSGAVDAVCSYQLFEHLTEPAEALAEMGRVARRDGRVLAVGPNLLSPLHAIRAAVDHARSGRVARPDTTRQRFFTGATALESMAIGVRNTAVLLLTYPRPGHVVRRFRIPDLTPPACADSDAIWLAVPTDLIRWARRSGLALVRVKSRARLRLGRFAGSYWLVFRKR